MNLEKVFRGLVIGLFIGLLSSLSLEAEAVPTVISSDEMRAQLKDVTVLTFDDESEQALGDIQTNKLHLNHLCTAIKKIAYSRPKAIFIDMDLSADLEAARCIVDVVLSENLKLVIHNDPKEILGHPLDGKSPNVGHGHVAIRTKAVQGEEVELRPIDVKHNWLNPMTRVSFAASGIIPFDVPAYFILLVMGLEDSDLRKLDWSWIRRIAVADFSENGITKVPLHKIAKPNISGSELADLEAKFSDRYVLVGVDQDKYDAFSNWKGEIVNGVFIHAHLLAAYKALMKTRVKIPKAADDSEFIYFGLPK